LPDNVTPRSALRTASQLEGNAASMKNSDAGDSRGVFVRLVVFAYGVYAWATFIVCVSAAVFSALVVPSLQRRRRWVSASARAWLLIAGIRTRLSGFDSIPGDHCIVVANHASYLDGLILQAFLPPRFTFVIKGEMQKVPLAHFLLRRIGSRFVERFVTTASSRDARNLLKAAAAGESLALFPEGTFHPEPGLHRFRLGAFAAALKANLAIVPVVIRGSRRILPARRILPRHGRLRIDVLEPVHPGERGCCNSRSLAAKSRQRILAVLDEPDLAAVRHAHPVDSVGVTRAGRDPAKS
jgi:1-acyl-sn-glycerol-3-phosphate acyltransferase